MIKIHTAALSLATALSLAVPSAVQAQESNSMRVSYADLNLASDGGRGTLQRRMFSAAKIVCVIEDSREIALSRATNDCRGDAITRAQPAYLAAVAAARHGVVTVSDTAALIITAY